ncbi:hypothetical protein ACV229_11630, partial [Burkholderia sp. MR1-5-21]
TSDCVDTNDHSNPSVSNRAETTLNPSHVTVSPLRRDDASRRINHQIPGRSLSTLPAKAQSDLTSQNRHFKSHCHRKILKSPQYPRIKR